MTRKGATSLPGSGVSDATPTAPEAGWITLAPYVGITVRLLVRWTLSLATCC